MFAERILQMKKHNITKIVKGNGIEAVRLFALYLAGLDGKTLCFADSEFEKYYLKSAKIFFATCQEKVFCMGLNLQPLWLTGLSTTVATLLVMWVAFSNLWLGIAVGLAVGILTHIALKLQNQHCKKVAEKNLLIAENLLLNLNRKA